MVDDQKVMEALRSMGPSKVELIMEAVRHREETLIEYFKAMLEFGGTSMESRRAWSAADQAKTELRRIISESVV